MLPGVVIDYSHSWHITIGDDVTLAPHVHILAHDASTKMHLNYARIGKVRIDIDWHPGLREALNTTPGRRRPAAPPEAPPTPFLDPELFATIPLIPIAEEAA